MKREIHEWQLLLIGLLVLVIVLQVLILYNIQSDNPQSDVHTVVLKWHPEEIPALGEKSGYVANWQPASDIKIIAVQVWMGNPYNILWEGDAYVTLNDQGDFLSPDQVIVHYQFDKHAESSIPHQVWFPVGVGNSGFKVEANNIIWVWMLFKNTADISVTADDGEVIIYYELE